MAGSRKSTSHSKIYKCMHCDYTSEQLFDFTDHLITHSRVYPHGCQQCSDRFSTKEKLFRHINFHHVQAAQSFTARQAVAEPSAVPSAVPPSRLKAYHSMIACPSCEYTTNRNDLFLFHLTKHINIHRYTCHLCPMNFHRLHYLRVHLSIAHAFAFNEDSDLAKTCENRDWYLAVKEITSTVQNFSLHIHDFSPSSLQNSGGDAEVTRDMSNECSLCGRAFFNAASLFRHQKNIHGSAGSRSKGTKRAKNFQCTVCQRLFYHRSLYIRHIGRAHESGAITTLNKDDGSAEVITAALAAVATSSEDGGKSGLCIGKGCDEMKDVAAGDTSTSFPVGCKLAGKSGLLISDTGGDITRTESDANNDCSICGKGYAYRANLYRHMQSVHGYGGWSTPQKYWCSLCNKSLHHKSRYLRHMIEIHKHNTTSEPDSGNGSSHSNMADAHSGDVDGDGHCYNVGEASSDEGNHDNGHSDTIFPVDCEVLMPASVDLTPSVNMRRHKKTARVRKGKECNMNFTCSICHLSFDRQFLHSHMASHSCDSTGQPHTENKGVRAFSFCEMSDDGRENGHGGDIASSSPNGQVQHEADDGMAEDNYEQFKIDSVYSTAAAGDIDGLSERVESPSAYSVTGDLSAVDRWEMSDKD